MSKPYPGPWILRSMLFTAGHLEKHINKSVETDADCIVLDLEDAVPPMLKANAREGIRNVLENGVFEIGEGAILLVHST